MGNGGTASRPAGPNLYGYTRLDLSRLMEELGVPSFHANQLYRWFYSRRQFDPEGWSDLPRELRRRLGRETSVNPGRITGRDKAGDGTIKYRIGLAGGGEVEAVYMVQGERETLCLSSQVGCALNCDFCLTGKMGLERHLSAGEILGQVCLIQQDRNLTDRPFNIVFMGMGEPLHNYRAVLQSIGVLCEEQGFGLSRRRITVSTVGLAPAIEKLANEPVRPRLAVSLNATTDEVRDRIMPINRKYPLARLLEACREFRRISGERFTLEYVLLKQVNDTDADIERLAVIARSVEAKVNLIPHNPVPGWLEYSPPSKQRILAFREGLFSRGVRVNVRWSRGAGARAACGQLALLPSAPHGGGSVPQEIP